MASPIKGNQKKSVEYYKHKWKFKPKVSSIFHFELANDGWISNILYVNKLPYMSLFVEY